MTKGTKNVAADSPTELEQKTSGASLVLTLWFVLVAVAFWGPYLGLSGLAPVFTALYGVFLLIAVAWGVLGFLRRREAVASAPKAEDAQP